VDRLDQACRALRVSPGDLVDAVCALSRRPVPPRRHGDTTRMTYGRVLDMTAAVPSAGLQPGDIGAAVDSRAGIVHVEVPPASESLAYCLERMVDDLGVPQLARLIRQSGITRDELLPSAVAAVQGCSHRRPPSSGRGRSDIPDQDQTALSEIEGRTLVDEIAALPAARWGRWHVRAVRTAVYRCLAEIIDVLLDISESRPAPLYWRAVADRSMECAATRIGSVAHMVVVCVDEDCPPPGEPIWPLPAVRDPRRPWRWQLVSQQPGNGDRPHGCGALPSALAARHAAECAVASLASTDQH
jgi:hypothetical protein